MNRKIVFWILATGFDLIQRILNPNQNLNFSKIRIWSFGSRIQMNEFWFGIQHWKIDSRRVWGPNDLGIFSKIW
jgi:hypothetical protein